MRVDRSVAFLTGMIFAAIYVILLIGFSRETYVLRGVVDEAPPARPYRVASAESRPVGLDQKQASCGLDGSVCASLYGTSDERAACENSMQMLRDIVGNRLDSLRGGGLERLLQDGSK